MHNMTNIDPIAISFIVFFSLFLGGFLLLICLGCVIHCCCTVDMPTYRAEFSDEAVICERLTKKERIAVIEKAFENYDHVSNLQDVEWMLEEHHDCRLRFLLSCTKLTFWCIIRIMNCYFTSEITKQWYWGEQDHLCTNWTRWWKKYYVHIIIQENMCNLFGGRNANQNSKEYDFIILSSILRRWWDLLPQFINAHIIRWLISF